MHFLLLTKKTATETDVSNSQQLICMLLMVKIYRFGLNYKSVHLLVENSSDEYSIPNPGFSKEEILSQL